MFVSKVLSNTPKRKLIIGITLLNIICYLVSGVYEFKVLDTCITANRNTQILQKEKHNFEKVKTINNESILTDTNKIYPMDFIAEEVYPLLPNNGIVYDTENKCILQEITYMYLVQNIILQLLILLIVFIVSKLFIEKYWWIFSTISLCEVMLFIISIVSMLKIVS